MDWTCSHCGCRNYHYNRSRLRNECDGCGSPLVDHQQEQSQMQYDRTILQAHNHLRAGNWNQVIALVHPLMQQNPADKSLYKAVLKASTKDYSDIEMNDPGMRAVASEAWNKLVRLDGLEGTMLLYSRRRRQKHLNELRSKKNKLLIRIFSASGFAVSASICLSLEFFIVGVLFMLGFGFCVYYISKDKPIEVIKQLMLSAPDLTSNPFI